MNVHISGFVNVLWPVQAANKAKDASLKKLSSAEREKARHAADRLAEQRVLFQKDENTSPAVELTAVDDMLEIIFERCAEHQAQEVHRADSEARNTSQVQDLQHELQAEIEATLQALREKALGIEQGVEETIRSEKAALTAQQVDDNLKLLDAINSLQAQVITEGAAAQERLALLEQELQAERQHKDELLAAQLLAAEQHSRDREAEAQKRKLFAEEMRTLQEQVLLDLDRLVGLHVGH